MNKPFITYKEENEQLRDKVHELEEFKENVVKECASIIKHAHKDIAKQLAASQAYAEQLREALEFLSARIVTMDLGGVVERALALPRDTSALDAFVEQKVNEIIESHAPDGRNVTNAQHVEMRHKFLEQIATLTRQRDLAVEALKWAADVLPPIDPGELGVCVCPVCRQNLRQLPDVAIMPR